MDILTFLSTIAAGAGSSQNFLGYIMTLALGGLCYYLYKNIRDDRKDLKKSLQDLKIVHLKCERRVTKLTFLVLKIMHTTEGINLPLVEKEVEGLILEQDEDKKISLDS